MPILGIIASQDYVRTPPTSYESIASTTVGSGGSATISFTSIPGTYKHLQLRAITRDNLGFNTAEVNFTFNSDTAANYSRHALYGTGSGALTAESNASTSKIYFRGGSNEFGCFVIDILEYANTNIYKTVRSLVGSDNNGSGWTGLHSGNWRSTSAITSITFNILNPTVTNFAQYSQIALYGIKGS